MKQTRSAISMLKNCYISLIKKDLFLNHVNKVSKVVGVALLLGTLGFASNSYAVSYTQDDINGMTEIDPSDPGDNSYNSSEDFSLKGNFTWTNQNRENTAKYIQAGNNNSLVGNVTIEKNAVLDNQTTDQIAIVGSHQEPEEDEGLKFINATGSILVDDATITKVNLSGAESFLGFDSPDENTAAVSGSTVGSVTIKSDSSITDSQISGAWASYEEIDINDSFSDKQLQWATKNNANVKGSVLIEDGTSLTTNKGKDTYTVSGAWNFIGGTTNGNIEVNGSISGYDVIAATGLSGNVTGTLTVGKTGSALTLGQSENIVAAVGYNASNITGNLNLYGDFDEILGTSANGTFNTVKTNINIAQETAGTNSASGKLCATYVDAIETDEDSLFLSENGSINNNVNISESSALDLFAGTIIAAAPKDGFKGNITDKISISDKAKVNTLNSLQLKSSFAGTLNQDLTISSADDMQDSAVKTISALNFDKEGNATINYDGHINQNINISNAKVDNIVVLSATEADYGEPTDKFKAQFGKNSIINQNVTLSNATVANIGLMDESFADLVDNSLVSDLNNLTHNFSITTMGATTIDTIDLEKDSNDYFSAVSFNIVASESAGTTVKSIKGIENLNTLSIDTRRLTTNNVAAFAYSGGTIDMTGKDINIYAVNDEVKVLDDNTSLKLGNGTNLYYGTNAFTGTSLTVTNASKLPNDTITGTNGKNILEIQKEAGANGAGNLKDIAHDNSKTLSEALLGSVALIQQGSEFIANAGVQAAVKALEHLSSSTFGAIGGGYSRYETGSHVDVTSVNATVGFAHKFAINAKDMAIVAPFIDMGYGDSTSHVDNTSADGEHSYFGGGILGRLQFDKLYFDASFRAGSASTEFDGKYQGDNATYDTDSLYLGAHFGLGYQFALSKDNSLDVYGKYTYTYLEGEDITLTDSAKSIFNTDDTTAHSTRLGVRFVGNYTDNLAYRAGLAWDHVFDGDANSKVNNISLDAPSLEGDSAVIEVGINAQLTKAFNLDFGLNGYLGDREGVQGSINCNYAF